jgi:hypothetical protein
MTIELKLNNDRTPENDQIKESESTIIQYKTIDKIVNFLINFITIGIYQIVLNSKFISALENNHTKRMFSLLKLGVQISESDMFRAAKAGHIPVMQVLLNHGGNINAIKTITSASGGFGLGNGGVVYRSFVHIDDRYSVLDLAVRCKHDKLANFLVDKQAKSVSGESRGTTRPGTTTTIYRTGGWFP